VETELRFCCRGGGGGEGELFPMTINRPLELERGKGKRYWRLSARLQREKKRGGFAWNPDNSRSSEGKRGKAGGTFRTLRRRLRRERGKGKGKERRISSRRLRLLRQLRNGPEEKRESRFVVFIRSTRRKKERRGEKIHVPQ